MDFTVEEINLMNIYDTSNKGALLSGIKESLPYVYEPEIRSIMEMVIKKLINISDTDFAQIIFTSDELVNEQGGIVYE